MISNGTIEKGDMTKLTYLLFSLVKLSFTPQEPV